MIAIWGVANVLVARARAYCRDEFGTPVREGRIESDRIDTLQLNDLTAVVKIGPPFNMAVAFSFETKLVRYIFGELTKGLDIPDDKVALYQGEAIAEVANIIIGHATATIHSPRRRLAISPPVVLTAKERMERTGNALFHSRRLETTHGFFDIDLVGRGSRFEDILLGAHGVRRPILGQLSVMVVDDSLLAAKKLSKILVDLGHNVATTVSTGKGAVAAYQATQPDLVTMDVTMPDMDGVEATKLLRGQFPDARIIMVTAQGQEPMVMGAIKAGAKGYVLKPVDKGKLDAVIQSVCKK